MLDPHKFSSNQRIPYNYANCYPKKPYNPNEYMQMPHYPHPEMTMPYRHPHMHHHTNYPQMTPRMWTSTPQSSFDFYNGNLKYIFC